MTKILHKCLLPTKVDAKRPIWSVRVTNTESCNIVHYTLKAGQVKWVYLSRPALRELIRRRLNERRKYAK